MIRFVRNVGLWGDIRKELIVLLLGGKTKKIKNSDLYRYIKHGILII